MDKKEKNPNRNNSMFLYTALIFVVALILIILAFFGKINRPDGASIPAPTETVAETDDVDKLKENIGDLNSQLGIYECLVRANAYAASANYDDAVSVISDIDPTLLTEEQRVLYDEIISKIDEGKEQ